MALPLTTHNIINIILKITKENLIRGSTEKIMFFQLTVSLRRRSKPETNNVSSFVEKILYFWIFCSLFISHLQYLLSFSPKDWNKVWFEILQCIHCCWHRTKWAEISLKISFYFVFFALWTFFTKINVKPCKETEKSVVDNIRLWFTCLF